MRRGSALIRRKRPAGTRSGNSAYTEADVEIRTGAVFEHIFYVYPTAPSPI